MLFNSYAFLLVFLPLTAAGYFLLCATRLAPYSQLWPLFEYWKKEVVRQLEPVVQRARGTISIFDFADYSSITAEPVPAPREVQSRVRWFWDAQHYKPELGNLVLDRLFGMPGSAASLPDDYGVRIDAATIDAHLAGIRAHQQAYAAAHADDMAEIRANVEKAMQTQKSPTQ